MPQKPHFRDAAARPSLGVVPTRPQPLCRAHPVLRVPLVRNTAPGCPPCPPAAHLGWEVCWWQAQSPPATGENQAGQAPSLPKCPSDLGAQIQLMSLRNAEMFPKPPSPSPNTAGFTFLTSLFWGPLTHPPRTCSSLFFFFFSIQSSLFFIVIALHYQFNLFPFLFIEHTLSWHKSHETK